ncbi:MAG: erythromycin esterase family protein [Polyangiales bacterium]
MISSERFAERGVDTADVVARQLAPLARPLRDARDLDPLLDLVGDGRYVLLGEATHGTSEFYEWRAWLTERLIAEKGFSVVAVEGDWPDCYEVDRYVKARRGAGASAEAVLRGFDRWPTWMWANREVAGFVERLRARNEALAPERRAGFYGLDVYSLWDSMRAVVGYLDRVDPEAGRDARRAYACFAPYTDDEQAYARATVLVPASCEAEVVRVLSELRARATRALGRGDDREARFDAEQNALVARNAESYYRTMVRGGAASWNVRDAHMAETLDRLMAFHGAGAKCVVWEHNTHVGDARFTEMVDEGEFNVGQLVRVAHGAEGVTLVGFSTHRGTVIAGDEWGAPMRVMPVPAAREGSYEDVLHRVSAEDKLLLLKGAPRTKELEARRGHRAIGVVYRPRFERYGNYVPMVLPRRYDALVYVDETTALTPLHPMERDAHEVPETFPTGM